MTFTYQGAPGASGLETVRFLIGDTDPKDVALSDEEIAYLLATYPDTQHAALRAVEAILAKLSGIVDESVGSVSVAWSKKREGYEQLYARLLSGLATRAVPYAGGIRRSDAHQVAHNPDRQKPLFTTGLHTQGKPDDELLGP